MSRLDLNIRRLEAQRACLNLAAELIGSVPGAVFELGLGNGRSFDHLRERLPGRRIFVFEREVAAHPDCIPDADHLFIGDIEETLPKAAERFPHGVALLHADIGTANAARDARLARFIAGLLPRLLAPTGVAAADRDIRFEGAQLVPAPGIQPDTYYLYRRDAAGGGR